jgi:ATP-dependent Clp protease protease subunit
MATAPKKTPKQATKKATKKESTTVKKSLAAKTTVSKKASGKATGKTASKSSGKGAAKKSSKKTSTQPVIQKSIFNDRAVELRGYHKLNAYTVVQIQQALVMQRLAKDGEGETNSSVKLVLGPSDANRYRFQDQAALADCMVMVRGEVDTLVTSALDVDGLKAFLSATGQRYMAAGAELYMGVLNHSIPYDKNRSQQVRRKLFNDYARDLILLVHEVSGEDNLDKIYRDLLSARGLSALEALNYGKHGLINGIVIGQNQIITRDKLDAYIKKEKLSGDALANFLRYYINVYQVPTVPLDKAYPQSLASGKTSFYKSMVREDASAKGKKSKGKPPEQPQFHRGEKPIESMPLVIRPHKDKPARRLLVRQLPKTAQSFLEEDALFFQDGFKDETAQQIGDALRALDHKKAKLGDKTPIKLIVNSPGGSVWSGQELRSLIKTMVTPVDIITMGMAASCGSWLLSSASGSRLATPQSRIMIHEAATQVTEKTPHDHYNEVHDDLDQSTQNYVAIVAEATGRPFAEVLKDFDLDVWFNPLEALFYGPKGLIDGIVVGPNQVLTKADVMPALEKALGGKKAFENYLAKQFAMKRSPREMMKWRPADHDMDDPFSNALQWIHYFTKQKRSQVDAGKALGRAVLSPKPTARNKAGLRTIDYYTVVLEK